MYRMDEDDIDSVDNVVVDNVRDTEVVDNSWMTPKAPGETTPAPVVTDTSYATPVVEADTSSFMTPVVTETSAVEEAPIVDTTPYIPETPAVAETPYVPETPIVDETPYIPETTPATEETTTEYTPITDDYTQQNTVQNYDNTPSSSPASDNLLESYYSGNLPDDFEFEDPAPKKTLADYKIWFILGGVAVVLLLLFYLPGFFKKPEDINIIPLLPQIVGERELLEQTTEKYDGLTITRYAYINMDDGKKDAVDYSTELQSSPYNMKMRYNNAKIVDTDGDSYVYSEVTKPVGDTGAGVYVGVMAKDTNAFVIIANYTGYKDLALGPYFFAVMSDSAKYNMTFKDFNKGTAFNEDAYQKSAAYPIIENAIKTVPTVTPTPIPVQTLAPTPTPTGIPVVGEPTFVQYHFWFTTLVPDTTIEQAKELFQREYTQDQSQYTFTYGEDKIILTYDANGKLVSKILNYGADMNDMKMYGIPASKLKAAKLTALGKTYDEIKDEIGVHAYLISQTFSPESDFSLTNVWVAEDGTTLTCKYDITGKCVSVE